MSGPALETKYADPTALGLLGLAIGCASLLPVAFGVKEAFAPEALRTTALFCLLFGGGCQFLAGLMSFANKNMLGGTLLTTFAFNWVVNAWAMKEISEGRVPSSTVILSIDVCFLVIFLVMTYAFGFFSIVLLVFLVAIDFLYIFRIAREVLHMQSLSMPIAFATVVLMLLALYIGFSLVLVNASGRPLLPIGTPVFTPTPPQS
jgi:succinate-acetate transporter protein